jgi:hypothetical protein
VEWKSGPDTWRKSEIGECVVGFVLSFKKKQIRMINLWQIRCDRVSSKGVQRGGESERIRETTMPQLASRIIFAVAVTALASCSAPRNWSSPTRSRVDHVVAVDDRGNLVDPYTQKALRNSRDEQSYLRNIANEAVLSNCKNDCEGNPQILIYVHGGLNKLGDAICNGEWLAQKIMDDSGGTSQGNGTEKFYPVFLAWNSGFGSSYCAYVSNHRRGLYRDEWWRWALSPFAVAYTLTGAVARTPLSLVDQLTSLNQTRDSWFYGTSASARRAASAGEFLSPIASSGDPAFGGPPGDDRSSRERFWSRTKSVVGFPARIVTTPLVDGLGTPAWDVMKARAHWWTDRGIGHREADPDGKFQRMWRTVSHDDYLKTVNGLPTDQRPIVDGSEAGVALRFANALEDSVREFSPQKGKEPELTLVGHSMGAIVINDILRLAPPTFKQRVKRVIFMAGADSIGNTEKALVPFLKEQENARFYNLTLHPVMESHETHFYVSPRGTLLEWIDAMFANPVIWEDRTIGRWSNAVLSARKFKGFDKNRVTFKYFPINECTACSYNFRKGRMEKVSLHPRVHGDFGSRTFWRAPFYEVAETGRTRAADIQIEALGIEL